MKHLKYFKESTSEITLKEKLESIVSMYEYIWENGFDPDSLGNLTGNCSVLFVGCTKVNSDWNISKKGGRPYEFDIDCLLKRLETDYRRQEKLEKIEELYKLSLTPRYKYSKEDIESILSPVLNLEVTGGKMIKSYEIKPYIDMWRKKTCFNVKCKLNEEFLTMDEQEVEWKKRANKYEGEINDFREIEKEFYSCRRLIISKIEKLNLQKIGLSFHTYDNTHLSLYFELAIMLEEI